MSSERIAVIGAGLMGHGIAQVFAVAGHSVGLYDAASEPLRSARSRIADNLEALGGDPQAVERVRPCAELADALTEVEFVFEAAPERVELKREIFRQLAELTEERVILASNTSVIQIGEIARDVPAASRARVVGTHWWNPPYLVPLVEVVQASETSSEVVARTLELLRSVGKEPVHVKRDVPGFVGNRLQHALWREAIALVADGVCDAETVDQVIKSSFGRRLAVMGPLETADYVGLDLTLDIHEQILHDLDRTPGPSPYLRQLVEEGRLGMKSGRGLREWEPGDRERLAGVLLRHLNRQDLSE